MNGLKTLLVRRACSPRWRAGARLTANNGNAKSDDAADKMARGSTTRAERRRDGEDTRAVRSRVTGSRASGRWRCRGTGLRTAKITVTDASHVTIDAGKNLSGDYVVQGDYLLIVTRDEQLRPLAWRINSPDSLTVVRSCETGNFTGTTMVRAASASGETEDDQTAAGGDVIPQ
jgi:hypothetical protein